MRRKSGVALLIMGLLLIVTTGCDTMSERFLPNPVEDRTIANDALAVPATSRDTFTFPAEVTLKRGGKAVFPVGFYNDLPMQARVMVASPDANVGFGSAQTESTVLCEDSRDYEFTLEFDSPLVNISVGEAMGFEVSINDKHGIMADAITCPITLFDAQSAKKVHTEDLIIVIVE